ncbi:hypothetical protein BS50DRAFT_573926 [Corynespora cassiicola Philippines]|uniref:Uncharacterized protein n=1 Tax=Corynespora cassiicola Philippines TaxID=1448308 RepID=A0A2T2NP24_CORCC|nr:hypothetical protein BS50DRAFT_573926 [Corynespora cassiicola Philippines]
MSCLRTSQSKRRRLDCSPEPRDHSLFLQTCLLPRDTEIQLSSPWASIETDDHTQLGYESGLSLELICFGTIPAIYGRCNRLDLPGNVLQVRLDSSSRFSSEGDCRVSGMILPEHGQMIQGLLDESSIELRVLCTLDVEPSNMKSTPTYSVVPCLLEIIVYGPFNLSEEIGEWFQQFEVYLQDPRVCLLDARYCNPQRLSSDNLSTCRFVSEIVTRYHSSVNLQDMAERPDLLDVISGQDNLEETAQPGVIRVQLHKHQKQALTFMLRRERGWDIEESNSDIWELLDSSHSRLYINRITGTYQFDAPPQFRGGIIADPMGLGKTLTMIALTATDLESHRDVAQYNMYDDDVKQPVPATLIIVPQPLLGTWEEQLSSHTAYGSVVACRHHGKTRLNSIAQISATNIVLTTYHTISADWKTSRSSDRHVIFSVQWRRIILDEAHLIRNLKTRMARAICELEAECRWAVTGTPIQNHLSDLTALLKFIRAHPYDDPKQFDLDISKMWKSGDDEEAVKRLKRLASCLVLRRAKKTIDLPARRDTECPVDFSKAERKLYNDIREQTIAKIDDALLSHSEMAMSGAYVNFLQQIESMRLVCNLGLHYHTRHDKPTAQEASEWETIAQQTFNIQRNMENITCSQCSSALDLTENLLEETLMQDSPQFSRCLKFSCADCSRKLRLANQKMVCGHPSRCPVAHISISNSAYEETLSDVSRHEKTEALSLPSKVDVLISDLKSQPLDVKSVVFSSWRLTLDVIEAGFTQAGIRSVRFDGKVPPAQRQPVLNQFRADPIVRVMLLTLQCGAVGLTLTEASRAYLMEPHWNPTIEEQALARIHRIGQKREVTTVRFYIRDSFEERVREVQGSKKNLAGVLLSGHDGGQADDSLGALQRLRSFL